MVAERLNSAFPELGWQPPQAGYLAWIDLRPLGVDDAALQRELIEREKVAIMPGTTYGCDGFVRFNVGCPRAKAEQGVDALIRALTGCLRRRPGDDPGMDNRPGEQSGGGIGAKARGDGPGRRARQGWAREKIPGGSGCPRPPAAGSF